MSIKGPVALLGAVLLLAACQSGKQDAAVPTQDNVARQPVPYNGVEVVRAPV